MLIEVLRQIVIGASGVGAIYLAVSPLESRRKWAGFVGLIGQPHWVLTSYHACEWGQLVVSGLMTFVYLKAAFHGVKAFFRADPVQGERV